MRHTVTTITAAGLIFAATAAAAWAQETTPLVGDIQAGKVTAEICAACHGAQGISDQPGVPHLSGQHAPYIQTGLLSYKEGHRKGTKMAEIVASLTKQDIANVAAYYSSLKPFDQIVKRTGPVSPAEEDPFAAVREATGECSACHGEDGNSDIPGMPSLAGQHVSYLINALKQYQDGLRKDEDMQGFVEDLANADLEDMAYFYAAMEPKRAEPPAEGDALAGLAITAPCSGCHGDDGNSKDPKTPRLAGLDAEYLIAAAEGYRSGGRDHDVMREALASLREAGVAALRHIAANAASYGIDLRRLGIGGDSAGAALAAAVALKARDEGGPALALQLLIYPTLGCDHSLPSFARNADAPGLTTSDMAKYLRLYTGQEPENITDVFAAPLLAGNLSGMPPAMIAACELDPLLDEAAAWHDKLERAGVPSRYYMGEGLVHGCMRARRMSPAAMRFFEAICAGLSSLRD